MRYLIASLIVFSVVDYTHAGRVRSYTRKDGTLVPSHERSRSDKSRWNNYGRPTKADRDVYGAKLRDKDRDGVPNYKDRDDNNDGVNDEK